MKRIIVTGSRHWRCRETIARGLLRAQRAFASCDDRITLVVGGQESRDQRTGARYGADYLAKLVAQSVGWALEEHKADWELGPRGGPIRNQRMVDLGAVGAVAFLIPELPCKGTRDCMTRLWKAHIPVLVCPDKEPA